VLLRTAAATAAVLALAACGGSKKPDLAKSALPPGCTVEEVSSTIHDFLTAPTLAPPGFFEVYGSRESDGRTFLTRKRAKALVHLRARHRLGERSRLIRLRIAQQDVNHARITFALTRLGPDFRRRGISGRLVNGAGTIDCAHQKVAAWVSQGP
jgi:hypothetical protein